MLYETLSGGCIDQNKKKNKDPNKYVPETYIYHLSAILSKKKRRN